MKPLLFRYAKLRENNDQSLPGHFCEKRSLWMTDEDPELPIVLSASPVLLETQSKTMTHTETDDDDQGRCALMETTTITRVEQEADDTDAPVAMDELSGLGRGSEAKV